MRGICPGLVCFCVALMATSGSAQLLDEVESGAPLTVGYTNMAPWAYRDSDGELTGLTPATLRHVVDELGGGEIRAKILDFGALINGLKSGRIDVSAAGMFVTPRRCEEVAFSDPTLRSPLMFIVPEGNPKDINSYADLRAHPEAKFAAAAGTIEARYAKDAGLRPNQIRLFPQTSDAILAVRTGRADAAGELAIGARYAQRQWPSDRELEVTDPIHEVDGDNVVGHSAFAVKKGADAFLDAMNVVLADYVGSAKHLSVLRSYGLGPEYVSRKSARKLCDDVS